MAYYTDDELKQVGFKYIGKNVKISTKASIYNHELIEIGDNSRIDDFCVLSGRITIGKNVHVAPFCLLAGGEKGIVMHDFSGCAYGVHAFSQSDDYSGETMSNPTIPKKFKNEKKSIVIIGRHVLVGARSIIMPGVTIGEGTAIGAMTLVSKSTDDWSIYIGIPAKRIKERSKNLLQLEKQFLEENK